MKKGDFLWLAALAAVTSIFVVPALHEPFVVATKAHPYMMGFVKFAILSTMGELLTLRIGAGDWVTPPGLIYRTLIWGVIGMLIVLMFEIFSKGVGVAVSRGMLYAGEGAMQTFLTAFYISAIMNWTFAPTFMAAHRVSDTFIDMACGEGMRSSEITLSKIADRIDWKGFLTFVVAKTVPIFWVPAHTITFLLPPEYRVIAAAYLSIALGAILAYAKSGKKKQEVLQGVAES